MNSDIFEGKWKQFVGAAKQRWAKLTDDDWTYVAGKKDELVGRIQERYGITRDEAQREADEFAREAQLETESESAAAAHTTGKF
jgi:uncharacterized protein YjbJ (UPF0337 family)